MDSISFSRPTACKSSFSVEIYVLCDILPFVYCALRSFADLQNANSFGISDLSFPFILLCKRFCWACDKGVAVIRAFAIACLSKPANTMRAIVIRIAVKTIPNITNSRMLSAIMLEAAPPNVKPTSVKSMYISDVQRLKASETAVASGKSLY